jgi:hypothetical protein
MSDHNLTGELVLREAYSAADGAMKMIPSSNTTFAIELDAADGDNVLTKPDNGLVDQAAGEVACVGMKTICLYGAATTVEVSPDDTAGTWHVITPVALTPMSICARRIRMTGAGKIVMQAV